jgi:hypothetical protein
VDVADLVPPGRIVKRDASRPGRRWRRLAHAPLLHFLLLGGALFALRQAWLPEGEPLRVAITAADVRDLRAGWTQQTGRPPTAEELDALIGSAIDDALLLEEAYARGWHRTDAVVQRRLIQNQRFLAPDDPAPDAALLERAFAQGMDRSDIVVRRRLIERMRLAIQATAHHETPTREELAAWLAAHPDRFVRPARTRLSHVYRSRDRRGDALARDAAALGERIAAEPLPPEAAARLSDPLLVSPHLPLWSESEIARQLGPGFAAAAMEAPVGEWSGPIASAYGLHFVFVHERQPAERPRLDEVASAVQGEVLREREQAAMRARLDALRARATITVAETTE